MTDQTEPIISAEPMASQPDRFPPQIKYIIWNEACERFS